MIVEEVKICYECAECKKSLVSTSYIHKPLEYHLKNLDLKCGHCYPKSTMRIIRMSIKKADDIHRVTFWGVCMACGKSATGTANIPIGRLHRALISGDLDGYASCQDCYSNKINVLRVHSA